MTLKAGDCTYFPQGVDYGPQNQETSCSLIMLQFPGPTYIPFISADELMVARRELAENGVFENGVYTWYDADGRRHNRDSHKACWEKAAGMSEPQPNGRFRRAVVMKADVFGWVPDFDLSGVTHKHLGTFTERRTSMGLTRIAAGAELPAATLADAEIWYLLEGQADYGGETLIGGKTAENGVMFYVPPGSRPETLRASTDLTLFRIGLPMIRQMEFEAERRSAA